jgi:Flp pilus assembly protein TadG
MKEKAMRRREQADRKRSGFVTVYMVFAAFTLIPIAGLAIDFGILYNVKARLQRACDAAVIGAGSEVQRSTDVTNAAQNAVLKNAVLRFFNANFQPAPFGASPFNYDSSITQDPTTKIRQVYVTATYTVPMLFMRVLHISDSQVGASAIANIRFVNMIIVVDRSGSVNRTGSPATIITDLRQFVSTPGTSIFVDGRDVVGLTTFGANYNVDFPATASFQTSTPNIGTAINNIGFDNNSTNTGEGLYQAWYQIRQLNQTGALNVILLMTDGRPSAFTANFDYSTSTHCTDKSAKFGVMDSSVSDNNNWQFPPPSNRPVNGILAESPQCSGSGCEATSFIPGSDNCRYLTDPSYVSQDITTIPSLVGPHDHAGGMPSALYSSTTPYYTGGGSNVSSPTAVRYAAFNFADNVATAIRTDTTYRPVIYAIGLNFNTASYPKEEPLDADWLARVANDPDYKNSVTGLPVFQANQTPGKYYNVTYSGLGAALSNITSQILRLAQ